MSLTAAFRTGCYLFRCVGCRKQHHCTPADADHLTQAYADWKEKHQRPTCYTMLLTPEYVERMAKRHEAKRKRQGLSAFGYSGNADAKAAYQAEQTMTVTNLHSLATSATAGWTSNSVDNTTNLYLDAAVQVAIAAVNTAPANSKATFVYAYHGNNSSDLTTTGTSGGTVGTEGSLTFPDFTTLPVVMPLLGVIPYPVQNKAINSPWMPLTRTGISVLPPYWGVAILNHTGMTYAASGNTAKYRGIYGTIA